MLFLLLLLSPVAQASIARKSVLRKAQKVVVGATGVLRGAEMEYWSRADCVENFTQLLYIG